MSHHVPFRDPGGQLQEDLEPGSGAMLGPAGEVPVQLASQLCPDVCGIPARQTALRMGRRLPV